MLEKIATLGPKGTYSELATKQYLRQNNLNLDIVFYNSLKKTLDAIGKEVEIGILPIENFSEGFVNLVLDYLVTADLYVQSEILLPIQFSLVSYCQHFKDIDSVYVQFVAKGQCAEYLDKFETAHFISTESNTESLLAIKGKANTAAVVPSHLLETGSFNYVEENITDYKNNQTRFLLLSGKADDRFNGCSADYKTSIIVLFHDDYPGYLEGVLHKLTKRNINITSIVSRPTRKVFGKYHFFIDLDGHRADKNLKTALLDIQQDFKVKILGSFLKH